MTEPDLAERFLTGAGLPDAVLNVEVWEEALFPEESLDETWKE